MLLTMNTPSTPPAPPAAAIGTESFSPSRKVTTITAARRFVKTKTSSTFQNESGYQNFQFGCCSMPRSLPEALVGRRQIAQASPRMRITWIGLVIALAACTRTSPDQKTPEVDAPPAPASPPAATPQAPPAPAASPAAPFPEPLPSGGVAAPVDIVVRNPGKTARSFGDQDAPLSGLSIAHERGSWGVLAFDRPHQTCDCRCGGPGRCPSCGARMVQPISIPAGGEQRLSWNGLLRRYRRADGDNCYETFAPPKGSYWVIPGGKDCAARRLELPATGPIVIELGDPPARACDPDPHFAERTARIALHGLVGNLAVMRVDHSAALAACDPAAAKKVDESALAAAKGPGACSLAVASGKHSVETRIWLDDKDYSTFFDLPGVSVTRVRHVR